MGITPAEDRDQQYCNCNSFIGGFSMPIGLGWYIYQGTNITGKVISSLPILSARCYPKVSFKCHSCSTMHFVKVKLKALIPNMEIWHAE